MKSYIFPILKLFYRAAKENEFLGYVSDHVWQGKEKLGVDSKRNVVNTPKMFCIALEEKINCHHYISYLET